MNPGIGHETGETVRSIVSVLGSQPMALGMIVSNFVMLGFLFYAQAQNHEAWADNNARRAELGNAVLKYSQDTNALLAKCVVPSPP